MACVAQLKHGSNALISASILLSVPSGIESLEINRRATCSRPLVNGQVVVAGGDNQVDPRNKPFLVDFVVMDQGPARSFHNSDPSEWFGSAWPLTCVLRIVGSLRSFSIVSMQKRISMSLA